MNTEIKSNVTFRDVLKLISTIISWTVFVLLLIVAALLLYYFVATRIYASKGEGYEPKFGLYTIISGSMTPNINVYDVVVDVRVDNPEDIEIGDVITFYSDDPQVGGGTITHRVISIVKEENGEYSYQTKGDYNLIEDENLVAFNDIVGKVALRIPQLGRIQFFLASSMGWLTIIMVIALLVIFNSFRKLYKLKQEQKGYVKKEPKYFVKIREFLNRPIFGTKKVEPKLLTYTPAPAGVNVSTKTSIDVSDLFASNEKELQSPIFDNNKTELPKAIFDSDDDFEIDDLPKLK